MGYPRIVTLLRDFCGELMGDGFEERIRFFDHRLQDYFQRYGHTGRRLFPLGFEKISTIIN